MPSPQIPIQTPGGPPHYDLDYKPQLKATVEHLAKAAAALKAS
jgi:hypothetical protein